eukprot:2658882-Rhodomonas_salina.1
MFKEDNDVFFGSFSKSLFTMFQIATGDGWASNIARAMTKEDGAQDPWAAIFLVSNVLIVGMVLINVVVAVLLDNFMVDDPLIHTRFEFDEVIVTLPL